MNENNKCHIVINYICVEPIGKNCKFSTKKENSNFCLYAGEDGECQNTKARKDAMENKRTNEKEKFGEI